MAYAALTSLANTIDNLLNDNKSLASLDVKPHLISLHEYITSYQAFLEDFPDKYDDLETQMRELANETEDVIEHLVLPRVRFDDESEDEYPEMYWHQVMEEVIKVIDHITREITEIKGSFTTTDVQDAPAPAPAAAAPPIHDDAMVGFGDHVMDVKGRLCGEETKLQLVPICGMGGIGKTTLAKNVYDDPLITESFDIRVWVTISQDYSRHRVFSGLLQSLKEFNTGGLGQSDGEIVYKILKGRRYLVVMDDIWSREAWDGVRKAFPNDGNGSRIVLTTRLSEVASYPDPSSNLHEMQLMDEDQSWNLFKKKVFKDEYCPPELENTGREIARSCKGLPLAVVVIAGLVSTVSKNPSSWKELAENVKSACTTEHMQIEGILSLSYSHLPQYLRPCFLYMGSFPEYDEIRVSKLIKLWVAEGFLKRPNSSGTLEEAAEECLEDLVKRNLVLVKKRKCDGSRIKSCNLHDLMRDLCIRKAHESKFLLNVMGIDRVDKEHFIESIENHRRLSIDCSSLNRLSSFDGSSIHTIRCSPSKHYRKLDLESLENVGFLRVLDAEFTCVESLPDQLIDLHHLRYLAVRHYGFYRIGFSHLRNLQTLIIKHSDKNGGSMHLELSLRWRMSQLRHVYYRGTIDFCDPEGTDCSLENLQTVSYVSLECCTERILKNIPNLKKLKIDCSGYGGDACLDDLVHLHRLENLEIYAGRWIHSLPKYYNFSFPKILLKTLTLRKLILPRNDMIAFGSLPNLQVLKLKYCTCVGDTWETTQGAFPVLEVLLIKSLSFEYWKTESSHFPRLKRLLLHSCTGLIEIPNDVGEITTLELIELKGRVRKSLVLSAKRIRKEQREEWGNYGLQVRYIARS